MSLHWDRAVELLSQAFGRSEVRGSYHVWWVMARETNSAPCPILARREGNAVHAWAGAPTQFRAAQGPLRSTVELFDVVQGARRVADQVP